ncbi:hypothetical protein B0H14DRAFT_3132490 [Mycena olivaceomarginata]|nr:hypothetical protein B0H14DRAFT_3132490 [Mycena olivaceomarginata]
MPSFLPSSAGCHYGNQLCYVLSFRSLVLVFFLLFPLFHRIPSTSLTSTPPLMPPRTGKGKPSVAKKAKQSELEKLIAQQKKTEKLLAEANTKLLAKRNADMLDEEEEAAPAKKKAKSSKSNSSAPASDSFGEDDAAALDGLLGSNRVGAADETDKDSEDESASDSGRVSLNNGEDMDNDEEDEEDDELPSIDSDMVIEDPIKKGAQRRAKKTSSSRVTQSTFTPTSVRLANVGRQAVRVEIATKEGFPLNHAGFALEAMSNVVAALDSPELVERLAMATDERRSQLIAYAWGGAPQVRGEVKTLCNGAVGLFGIPGDLTPEQIETHIRWLTGKTSIFKFGGIDLETHNYDVQQPYGAPFYKDVMTKQWFDSAKSEGVRAASFQRFIDSPVPVLTLITDGMENSLKEWATGVRIKIKFTEEEFAPRYQHHRAALLNLQANSPTWFAQFQRNLYSKIVTTSNFPHLKSIANDSEGDELKGVDFEALEASATAKEAAAK